MAVCDGRCAEALAVTIGGVAGLLAADAILLRTGHDSISDVVGDCAEAHPVVTVGVLAYLYLHFCAVLFPEAWRRRLHRWDVLSRLAEWARA